MEVVGYTKLQTTAPPQDMATEVERSFRSRPILVSGPVTYGRGDHDACESYLKFGIEDGEVCLSMQWQIYRANIHGSSPGRSKK